MQLGGGVDAIGVDRRAVGAQSAPIWQKKLLKEHAHYENLVDLMLDRPAARCDAMPVSARNSVVCNLLNLALIADRIELFAT